MARVSERTSEVGSGFARVPRLVRIADAAVLEGGSYWPELRPHFANPDYRRLRYSLGERVPRSQNGAQFSFRGAASVDALDLAFIADRHRAALTIAGAGLPDYCLTLTRRGGLICTGVRGAADLQVGPRTGLIYRGRPGTTLAASGSNERIAIWIPVGMLRARLSALLGEPLRRDVEFQPLFDWGASTAWALNNLVGMLIDEFAHGRGLLSLDLAGRSFADLFLYTLLRSVQHSHSDQLDRPAAVVLPGTLKRAEAFIEANVEEPLALHEVAAAAGCSVRSLQAAFHRFRDTTPLHAIRDARLHAAHAVLGTGEPGMTVSSVALRFGFTNAGRFTQQFRKAFGVSPADVLRRARH